MDYLKFYNLEQYLFDDVHSRFHREGSIGAFDFFAIIIWKANRAKTYPDLEEAARTITRRLNQAPDERDRLRQLMKEEGFQLPMSSAILSVLWPEEFTVYDIRVCDELGDFHRLKNRTKFEDIWKGYREYVSAVERNAPEALGLRDKDRYLWGRSAARQLEHDLKEGFGRTV